MGRSRSSSSSSKWRYLNPAYYLKRPKRLAFLFMGFVIASLLVWDRQTLVREHEEEVCDISWMHGATTDKQTSSLIQEVNDLE